jgi:diguanylate cyclase (GGDEF)-like protein
MQLIQMVRAYFAPRPHPYAGGDLGNAQRLGAIFWGMLVVLTVVLWSFSPPNQPIGAAGWIPAVGLVVAGAGLVYAMRRGRITSWEWMLALSYVVVLGIVVMQWLGGGVGSPYEQLLLLPLVFVAAIQPPRRIGAFLGFVALTLAAPFVYDRWGSDAAGAAAASWVIWSALALGASLLMSGVRAQRLAMAEDEAEAREEARVDALTGLRNRRAFDEAIELETKRARRLHIPLTMAMIDIENFKEINDRWSYAEGDRALQEVSKALVGAVREPDLCFRWGGDEFALILGGTAARETAPIAQRVREEVYSGCRRPDDEPIRIRFAVAELTEDTEPGELVEMAGLALTAAKLEAGR